MKRRLINSGHRWLYFLLILLISGVTLGLNQLSSYQDSLSELPHYPAKTSAYLGVKIGNTTSLSEAYNAAQVIVIKPEGDIDTRWLSTMVGPWEITNCPTQVDVLCAIKWQGNSYTLFRWKQPFQSDPITETGQLANHEKIIAVVPRGVFFAQLNPVVRSVASIRFKPKDGPQLDMLPEPLDRDCGEGPMMSPSGEYLAALCLRQNWFDYLQGLPPQPVDEQLHVVKISDTSFRELINATTYLWGPIISMNLPVSPSTPEWIWAPDGSEIAFIASFSSPVEAPIARLLAGSPSRYKTFGGIYSITVPEGALHKWIEVGDQNPQLAWSPDGKYIAYALPMTGEIHIVSQDGKHRPIGNLHNVTQLTWSSEGAYIAAVADHTLWILTTSDYTWRTVNLSGAVVDTRWATTAVVAP